MRRSWLAFLLAGLVSGAVAEPRIINGTTVTQSRDFQVAMFVYSNGGYGFFCGGSLINQKYVLTASHCVDDLKVTDDLLMVIGDLTPFDADGEERKVTKIYMHPSYNPNTMVGDIAIMELEDASTKTPIGLQSSSPNESESLVVQGWGKTLTANFSQVLLEATVEVQNQTQCANAYANAGDDGYAPINITSNMLCASAADTDSCQGDSGGPLMEEFGSGFQQVGVVSFGIGCALADYPGVYTRITSYRSWIDSVVVGNGTVTIGRSKKASSLGFGVLALGLILLLIRRKSVS